MKKKCMTVLTVLLLLNTAMAQTRVAISMNDLSTARTVAVASEDVYKRQAVYLRGHQHVRQPR